MTCPCCKNEKDFKQFYIDISNMPLFFKQEYEEKFYKCPKCGVIFQEIVRGTE